MDQKLKRKQKRNHRRVWNMIFKDKIWLNNVINDYKLNPILMGPDLNCCYENKMTSYNSSDVINLVLVTSDTEGTRTSNQRLQDTTQTFLSSLKEFNFEAFTGEIWIKSENSSYPKIKLNASSVFYPSELIHLQTVDLLSKNSKIFYLFKKDEMFALRTTYPDRVKSFGLPSIQMGKSIFLLKFTQHESQKWSIVQYFAPQELNTTLHRCIDELFSFCQCMMWSDYVKSKQKEEGALDSESHLRARSRSDWG